MAPHQLIQRNNPNDPALVVVDRDANNEEEEDADEGVSDDEEEDANEGLDEDDLDEADQDNSDEVSNNSDEFSTGSSNEGSAGADFWDICTFRRSKTLGPLGFYQTSVDMQPKGEVQVTWNADRHNPDNSIPNLDVKIVGVDANGLFNITIRENTAFKSIHDLVFSLDEEEPGVREDNIRTCSATPDEDGVYTTIITVSRDHFATIHLSDYFGVAVEILVNPANDEECFDIVIAEHPMFVMTYPIRFKYVFDHFRLGNLTMDGGWDRFVNDDSNIFDV